MAKDAAVIRATVEGRDTELKFGKNAKVATVVIGSDDAPSGFVLVTRSGRMETFDLRNLSTTMHDRLAWHGLKQKVSDSFAALDDDDEVLEAARKVYDNLLADRWAGIGSGGDASLLEAVLAVTGGDREETRAKLKALSAVEREGLRQHPPIKAELDRRAAERAKGIDVGALLGKLA